MSEHRYTAQEMRDAAGECMCVNPKTFSYTKIYLMLRQAADAEEDNAKLRETINADSASMAGKDAVIAQLKARLEAQDAEIAELKSKMNDVVCENEALRDACGTCSLKREVAELRECLKEAIIQYCTSRPHEFDDGFGNCENFKNGSCVSSECWRLDCINKWRKALEGDNHEGK